tara:strand:+ start:1437 stop:1694 length:258 start_codon:yes stop_codon:yes gene_type:complete
MITNPTSIAIIELKREYYIAKKRKNIEIKNDYEKEGKKIEALALKLLNDQIQETIQDLSEMIQQIKNISTYQENCINLITNQLKK